MEPYEHYITNAPEKNMLFFVDFLLRFINSLKWESQEEFKKPEFMNLFFLIQTNKLPKKKPLPLLHLSIIAFPAGPSVFMRAHKHRISALRAGFIQFFNTIPRNFVFGINFIGFSFS